MTIKIFTCSWKKTKKKQPTPFLKKTTFTCWTRLKTKKLLATAKQLIRKTSVYCLKNQEILFAEWIYRYAWLPPLPVCFCLFFKDPTPPSTLNVLFEWPPIIMSNTTNLEIYPFINFIWEQHHHLVFVAIVW